MNLLTVIQSAAPYLQTAATLTFTALAGQAITALRKIDKKAALDTLRHLAETYVRAVEQQQAKTVTNPAKKALVFTRLKQALPWMPDVLIDAAIEAAVSLLPQSDGTPVPMTGPTDTGGTSVPPQNGGA